MASTQSHPQADPSSTLKSLYTVEIEGQMSLFVDDLPNDLVMASGGTIPGMKLFMYAWVDNERGASGHVSFPTNLSPGDGCESSTASAGGGNNTDSSSDGKFQGRFRLSIDVRDGDSHLLKVQCCVRLKDPASRNKRTFTVAVSCADLEKLLCGEEDQFVMKDSFDPNDYVVVSMRASNAADFRNHPSSAHDMGKPLLKLGPSALDRIAEWDKVVQRVSDSFVSNAKQNNMGYMPGVALFMRGITT
jgi:hypothetical protein